MALGIYQNTITLNNSGQSVPSAVVQINNTGPNGTGLATLWQDRAGTSPAGNPVTADASGKIAVYLEPSRYKITVTAPGGSAIYEDVEIVKNDLSQLGGNIDGNGISDINAYLNALAVFDYSEIPALASEIGSSVFNAQRCVITKKGIAGLGVIYNEAAHGVTTTRGCDVRINDDWVWRRVVIGDSVDLGLWEGVADYNSSGHTGTDNSASITEAITWSAQNGKWLSYIGYYMFTSALLFENLTIRIRCGDVGRSALYYKPTTGDAITMKSCNFSQLINFVLLGAYNAGTATTNKGLVLRQCAYVKTQSVSCANFQDCYQQDGGYLHEHNDMQNANYQRSPIRYTYNEYGDTAVGMAHNKYNDAVVSHEINGAGAGIVIQAGEVTFDNPQAEDHGQDFINISYTMIPVQNVYIHSPTVRADVSGARGRCLSVKGNAAQPIREITVTNPDFVSEAGFNVIDLDGPEISNIKITGGTIQGGEYGLRTQNGCRNILYFPDKSSSHQLNAIRDDSTGDFVTLGCKQISSSNLGNTLTGAERAHIYIPGQNTFIQGGTTFADAFQVDYGVSRASSNPNVSSGTCYDVKRGLVAVTNNIASVDVNTADEARSSANFLAAADAINTKDKFAGRTRFDATTGRNVSAVGTAATSVWNYQDGTVAYTPV